LAALSGESDVIYISSDRNFRGFLTNSAPAVNAPYAWSQSLEGSGISVAVFDSGIGLGATRTSAGLGRQRGWGSSDDSAESTAITVNGEN